MIYRPLTRHPLAFQLAGYCLAKLSNRPNRTGVRIFNYHGLVEKKQDTLLERNLHLVDDFRLHLEYLRRFPVLSMAELIGRLERPAREERLAAMITFDDGYANNLIAAEMLSRLRLPFVVFVSTGVLDPMTTIWTVELSLLMLHGEAKALTILGAEWALDTRERRVAAFQTVRRSLKAMPAAQCRQVRDAIRAQFPAGETQRLLEKYPYFRMLSWPEASQLRDAGGYVGSHGVWHEIQHEQQSADTVRSEIFASKSELESKLGQPCEAFAYPNGNVNALSAECLANAGYKVALTTRAGTFTGTEQRYTLPRLTPAGAPQRFVRDFLVTAAP